MSSSITSAEISEDILNKYHVIKFLVDAGQSRIFTAERRTDGKAVVLKRYNRGTAQNLDDFNKAEEGAAKEIAFLLKASQHSRSDVPVYLEHGSTGLFNDPVLVMERIHGQTLEERLSAQSFNPNLDEALHLAKSVASTLKYAHQQVGIEPFIHRDLKPANIMIDHQGKVIVLDWSTAKIGSGDTLVNTMFHSFYYSPPEVTEGRSVSPATDVFGLGQLLKHYLLGKRFIEKKGVVTINDFKGKNLPQHLLLALDKATRTEMKERYQSVEELVKAFENKVENDPKLAGVDGLASREDGLAELAMGWKEYRDRAKGLALDSSKELRGIPPGFKNNFPLLPENSIYFSNPFIDWEYFHNDRRNTAISLIGLGFLGTLGSVIISDFELRATSLGILISAGSYLFNSDDTTKRREKLRQYQEDLERLNQNPTPARLQALTRKMSKKYRRAFTYAFIAANMDHFSLDNQSSLEELDQYLNEDKTLAKAVFSYFACHGYEFHRMSPLGKYGIKANDLLRPNNLDHLNDPRQIRKVYRAYTANGGRLFENIFDKIIKRLVQIDEPEEAKFYDSMNLFQGHSTINKRGNEHLKGGNHDMARRFYTAVGNNKSLQNLLQYHVRTGDEPAAEKVEQDLALLKR